MDQITKRFAAYQKHNPYWGVFHHTLEEGDFESPASSKVVEEELALIEIYNGMTPEERKALKEQIEK